MLQPMRQRTYLPPIGYATGAQLAAYATEGLCYQSRLRARDVRTWRKAELMDAGAQWLKLAQGAADEFGNETQWVDMYWGAGDDARSIPTPVFNEGLPIRMNESARLGRPQPRPLVKPRTSAPSLKASEAATKGTRALKHRLREMDFDTGVEPLIYYHQPVYGGVWMYGGWDQTWDRTTVVPAQGAVHCEAPGCSFKLSSTTVHMKQVMGQPWASNNAVSPQLGSNFASVRACPTCPDNPDLMPFKPSLQEATTGIDAVGRPMGTEEPLGDWIVRVLSPYDVFERNLGLDKQPGTPVDEVVYAHVEHLDWVALRWPDLVDQVEPENPATLAKYHPIMGAPDVYMSVLDPASYRDCARVKEVHRRPWMEPVTDPRGQPVLDSRGRVVRRMNRGRSFVVAGNVKLLDGPYMVESLNRPGELVERALFEYQPWEYRDGGRRRQGIGLWENLFSPQETRNETASQTQAVRRRLAVPIYLALRQHNFDVVALRSGMPGAIAEIDVVGESPAFEPKIINNTTIDSGVQDERQDAIAYMERMGGRVEVEKGQVPGGIEAAQAIKYLKASAGEGREPRIKRISGMLRNIYRHGLRLMQALYVEERDVRFEDEDGDERWESLKGTDLDGEVEIETEPDFQEQTQQIETVNGLMRNGVLDVQSLTRAQRRRIAKLNDAPSELFEDDDLQEASAQREYVGFQRQNRVPQVDPALDDHSAHFEVHGRHAHSEWFRDLEERGNWDGALAVLGPRWYEDLQMLVMMVAPPAIPGMPPPPAAAGPSQSLQEQIRKFWTVKLQVAIQMGALQVPDNVALAKVVNWRSHMEAHRLEDERKQTRAAVQPTLAAPGGDATAAGNQPTAGTPPAAPMAAMPAMGVQ